MALQKEHPGPQQDEKGRFLPGNSGFGGRPKGSRNKLGEEFVAKLYADFQQHGDEVIEKVRREKSDQYLKVIAMLMPKEVQISDKALADLSDNELVEYYTTIRSIAAAINRKTSKDRAIAAARNQETGKLVS